jgi:(S)-2-hydroxy-acid oxidase
MLNIRDFVNYSSNVLSKSVRDYFSSGANDEQTLRENCNAFSRLRIRPRFLRDVSERHLSTTILGDSVSMPICASPSAMQKLADSLGEAYCQSFNR